MKSLFLTILCLICGGIIQVPSAQSQDYDIVINNGRVIDPETKLDAVRHVGIKDAKIALISKEPLKGKIVIDATGLIVAPGFVDFHAHGQNIPADSRRTRRTYVARHSPCPFRGRLKLNDMMKPTRRNPSTRLRSILRFTNAPLVDVA